MCIVGSGFVGFYIVDKVLVIIVLLYGFKYMYFFICLGLILVLVWIDVECGFMVGVEMFWGSESWYFG